MVSTPGHYPSEPPDDFSISPSSEYICWMNGIPEPFLGTMVRPCGEISGGHLVRRFRNGRFPEILRQFYGPHVPRGQQVWVAKTWDAANANDLSFFEDNDAGENRADSPGPLCPDPACCFPKPKR